MNDIYEAVRASIKSKIPRERVVDDQVVQTNRDEILNLIPFHVKRAVNRLQNRSIIPPKTIELTVDDRQPYTNQSGEIRYEYLELPNDFSEIIEFTTDSVIDEYEYWGNVNNIDRMSKLKDKPLYKVERIQVTKDTDIQPVLVLSPYPEQGSLFIRYKFNPTDEYVQSLDQTYWNSIITQVESLLGIGNKQDAEEEAYDLSRKWRQPKQQKRTRLKPNSFYVGYRRNRLR